MTHPVPTGVPTRAGAAPAVPAPAGPAALATDAPPPPADAVPATDAAPPADAVDVRLTTGRGGLPSVVVTTPTAHAEVYLQGAHVTSWAPAGVRPVVWTSDRSAFAPGVPIRGGVPVCFPWFGPDPAGRGPLHGPVRVRPWTFAGWASDGDDVVLTFDLSSDASDGPHPFALRYTVTVGAALTLALQVVNPGPEPLHFEEALHTYLAVDDVRETTLVGLGDLDRLDRLSGRRARTPGRGQMHVVAETDHLYSRPGAVTVLDWAGQRSVRVTPRGSANAVVWNPWADKSAALPDLADDDWTRLLCVETCNVADAAVVLAPGGTHTMAATFDVGPLP